MGGFIVLVIIGIIIWAVVSANQKMTAEKAEADMRKYRNEKEKHEKEENERYTKLVAAITKVKEMNPLWVVGGNNYSGFISFKSSDGFEVNISSHYNVPQYRLNVSFPIL